MSYCSLKWCGKTTRTSSLKKDGITFHRFPTDPKIKKKWVALTGRENWYPSKTSRVCSRHFTEDCFHTMKSGRRRLFDTAVPTKYLAVLTYTNENRSNIKSDRHKRSSTPSSTSSSHSSQSEDETPIKKENKSKSDNQPGSKPRKEKSKDSAAQAMIKKRLCRRIVELTEKLNKKNKDLKILRDKVRYYKKKVAAMQTVIEGYENK